MGRKGRGRRSLFMQQGAWRMKKIGIIIPEGQGTFRQDAEQASARLNVMPVFCAGHFAGVLPTVRAMLSAHPDIQALVARSTTAIYLRKSFDLPVVDLELSSFDLAKTLSALEDKSGKFVVVQFLPTSSTYDTDAISKICGIDLKTVFLSADRPGDIVRAVEETGCDRVVSSVAVVTDPCRRAGKEVILLPFSREAVETAIRQAVYMVDNKGREAYRTEQLLQMLNAFSEGFMAVDRQGNIIMFNQALSNIAGVRSADAVGARLSELRDESYFIRTLAEAKDEDVVAHHGKRYIINTPYFPATSQISKMWCVSSLSKLQERTTVYQKKLADKGYKARYHFNDIVSSSAVMAAVKEKAKRYAQTNCNILILGESGTGKEMMAQSIHNASSYREGPFVAINCAALPKDLLESELFGYEEGAFTGARRNGKEGLFELSDHGTLFLDEIGLMPLSLQAKLLRSLQEKQISRVGGTRPISVVNRIICATNDDLVAAIGEGTFREDLFYRLDVLHIRLPPLRERTGDIPFLVRTLLRRKGAARRRLLGIEDRLMHYFTSYAWPGNFRQLDAFLERLLALNPGYLVQEEVLRQLFAELPEAEWTAEEEQRPAGREEALEPGDERYIVSGTIAEAEEQIIREAYGRYGGNMTEMARRLGIGRTTLWRKCKALGIQGT